MNLPRKIFYTLFAIVTVSVGLLLALWGIYKAEALLVAVITSFALFTLMFLVLLIVGCKFGWKGEKTLSYRLAHEPLCCDLYILKGGRKRYALDLYPAGDAERFRRLLQLAEGDDGDAIALLGEECLGQRSLSPEALGKLRGKTIATSAIIHASLGSQPALKEFLVKNTFVYY